MNAGMGTLTSKEKAALRNAAQKLKPAIHVGKRESPRLCLRSSLRFESEQLVKVAFKANRDEISTLVDELESKSSTECIGGVGKRRSFCKPKVELS